MKVHLVQMDIAWEDKAANYRTVERLVSGTDVRAGDLVVLPEMFDTGFSFNVLRTADSDGETAKFLSELATRRSAFVHGSRTLADSSGRGRNLSTILNASGQVIAEYEKIHPFTLGSPGERESDYFAGGARVTTYEWTGPEGSLRVCPTICFDLRFPELFRRGLLAGAEMFVVPANWPVSRAAHFRALLCARAIENQAYVVGVNRVGRDPKLQYQGASVVIDPMGSAVAELTDREEVLSVPIESARVSEWRARFPAWCNHRLLVQPRD